MMRNTSWKLKRVKDRLIKDLKVSTLSFGELGKRYGVSRQAIFAFCQVKGIKRPKRPKREHTKECSICQSIMRIAKKPHSDFISSPTIKKQLGLGSREWKYHIRVLRKKGIVSARFGRLRSKRMEQAYQIYFKKGLLVKTIGEQVGFKNLRSMFRTHRTLGYDVPDPLFTYDSNDRSKAVVKMNRKKRSNN